MFKQYFFLAILFAISMSAEKSKAARKERERDREIERAFRSDGLDKVIYLTGIYNKDPKSPGFAKRA